MSIGNDVRMTSLIKLHDTQARDNVHKWRIYGNQYNNRHAADHLGHTDLGTGEASVAIS